MLSSKKTVYFIGIGGAGMSGIAHILLEEGIKVKGSDIQSSKITKRLQKKGAEIFIGHKSRHIQEADLLVYSSAIRQDNPELEKAKLKKIPIFSRAEVLAELTNQKKAILITGTHGKTTTTALIAQILLAAGLDPSVVIGGETLFLKGNARRGRGKYFVAEADESDGSFLCLSPTYPVITNIDSDHLDYYENLDKMIAAFEKFMASTKSNGCIFSSCDSEVLRKILSKSNKEKITFGLSSHSDIYAENIKLKAHNSHFDCIYKKKSLGRVNLSVPGSHNVVNALGALALALKLKVDFKLISDVLSRYQAVERRFQIKARISDIIVVDDYAHHPTEIQATLEAAKNFKPQRIIGVFQPHRYTRTQLLEEDFGGCFSLADKVIITDIYSATEEPIEGVSGKNIYQRILKAGHQDAHFIPKEEILVRLMGEIRAGDIILIMGAGDITDLTSALVRKLKKLPSLKSHEN